MDLSKGHATTITIPATAGNATYNCSPGTGKRYLILRGIITLVTDATVANRIINLITTDGTNITNRIGSGSTITASLTRNLTIGPCVLGTTFTPGWNQNCGTSRPIMIDGAQQFRITVTNGVAGDSFSGYLEVLEVDT